MPENKKQLRRMTLLIAKMKENSYPNCRTFLKYLEKSGITCTPRTLLRDIKALRGEFDAPILYDAEHKGYYLSNNLYQFACPDQEEDEMIALILGGRIAEDIFPTPLRERIKNAVAFKLANSYSEYLESAPMRAISVSSKLKVPIPPEIFMPVFDGWRRCKTVRLTYRNANGKCSDRLVEPHALTFLDSSWYLKGVCIDKNRKMVFAARRIQKAELTDKNFTPDAEIASEVEMGRLFEYPCLENVSLLCDNSIRDFVETDPFHPCQRLTPRGNDKFLLIIPEIPEHEISRWVLYQGGLARALAPECLVRKITSSAQEIVKKHGPKESL